MASTLPILTFHDISSRHSVISFSPELFHKGISSLYKRGYKTLNLAQLINILSRGDSFPDNSFMISFDDGYQSVYEKAFPVLTRYHMTAVVFITSGEQGKHEFSGRVPSLMGNSMLSWNEIREMHSSGLDFGAHTLTHPDLTKLPPEKAKREIHRSKKILEDALSSQVISFAYPFGRYNRQIRRSVKQLFSCAFSDKLGLTKIKSDPYTLERVDCYYLRTDRTFNLILTKIFPLYIKARNMPRIIRRKFSGYL